MEMSTVYNANSTAIRPMGQGRFGMAAAAESKSAEGDASKPLKVLVNQFVNQVFYGTLLREFRNAQQPTLLDNGPGAQTFLRHLDMELISRISQRGESALSRAVLKQLLGPEYTASSNTPAAVSGAEHSTVKEKGCLNV